MQKYDIALKSLLKRVTGRALSELTGFSVERWHDVNQPTIKTLQVDLLGETSAGELVHIELQSTNDREMPIRMAEYALAILRSHRRLPHQIVLYTGESRLRMESAIDGKSMSYVYRLVDIRELDSAPLLESVRLEDNVVSLLLRLADQRSAVRNILDRIVSTQEMDRGAALEELIVIAGLRSLGAVIKEEARKMPILNDIMDHDLLGPLIRQGREEGRQEVREEMRQHERGLITRMIEKRLGSIPDWARKRLESADMDRLEVLSLKLLDAGSFEELLQ